MGDNSFKNFSQRHYSAEDCEYLANRDILLDYRLYKSQWKEFLLARSIDKELDITGWINRDLFPGYFDKLDKIWEDHKGDMNTILAKHKELNKEYGIGK